jgi:glutaredoxin-related protein/thiol-disulfide isomerase/thioredoxin
MSLVQTIDDELAFNHTILSLRNSPQISALNFNASWAEPCTQMNAVFSALSESNPAVKFYIIDAGLFLILNCSDEYSEIAEHYEIESVPSFVILRGHVVIDRVVGANAQDLSAAINKATSFIAQVSKPAPPTTTIEQDLDARLESLISSHPMMLFIKGMLNCFDFLGTPTEPKCKFSKELLSILSELEAGFASFNILSNDDVRQGLKALSDWPTFPQGMVLETD